MKNIIKKLFVLSSVLCAAVLLSGCMGCNNNKRMHPQDKNMHMQQQKGMQSDNVTFYQTYEDADVTKVHAKMYTHSSHGGESRMGYIKFYETDAGLKMDVDLKDLRPGVTYTMSVHQCNKCSTGMCCNKMPLAKNMPTLRIEKPGKLEESFVLHGMSAEQLLNAKIYLERDGGYKAAWGMLKPDMTM